MLSNLLKYLRLRLGFSTVPEICEASRGVEDYHDYHSTKGGDGVPTHLHNYTCWKCGKKFSI